MTTLTEPEQLWRGPTGAAYHRQHTRLSVERSWFWAKWQHDLDPTSVLEVGCGAGANLGAFPRAGLRVGLDVSPLPLRLLRAGERGLPVLGSAGRLPLRSRSFDLVVTAGCLIHVPWEQLGGALLEIGRVAKRDVLLIEYDDGNSHVPYLEDYGPGNSGERSAGEREIPWRGHRGVLWARSYGYLFWRGRSDFVPMARADLTAGDGWDRTTLAWFRRRAGT